VDPVASAPLVFRQGDRPAFSILFKRGEEVIDLTDWTFQSHLRKVPAGAILAEWDVTVADPTTGVVVFSLEPSVTLALPPTPPEVFWGTDGWATAPDGTPHPIARRQVQIAATFTHS